MDRSEDIGDSAAELPTAGRAAVRTSAETAHLNPPLPRAARDVALDFPRPYAVASLRHTLPPPPQKKRLGAPVPSPALSAAAFTESPPQPLMPLAYRTPQSTAVHAIETVSVRAQSHVEMPPRRLGALPQELPAALPEMPDAKLPDPPRPMPPAGFASSPVPALPSEPQRLIVTHAQTATAAFDTQLHVGPLRGPAGGTLSPLASPLQQAGTGNETSSAKTLLGKALYIATYAFAGYMALVLALIVVYRFVNPPMSSLMLQQRLAGQEIMQDWVSLDDISQQIVRAVLVSEDGRFCQHHGIDLLAMEAAIQRASDGVPRGASTISMQVTKNLFLWPSKSYIRKAIEIPLTLAIELLWPKWRIMEVYLNIAEWGPGIFGVEEASRFHFDKAAKRLNEREAAQLAVALPNPFSRDPGEPGPGTRRLAGTVQGRMRGTSPLQTACVLSPRHGR